MACDLDWAVYYAWRFLGDQKIKFSLRISTKDIPVTLWKGLYFTFTLTLLGDSKGKMEETKPEMKGQGFNICKCFYIS